MPVPDLRDGVTRLALPEGFTYRSFHMAGTPLVEASAASRARLGGEGTTIVKRTVQTDTHESPIHVAFLKSRPSG